MQYAHRPLPKVGYPHAGQIDERVSNCDAAVIGMSVSRCPAPDMSMSPPFPQTALDYPVILLLTLPSPDFFSTKDPAAGQCDS